MLLKKEIEEKIIKEILYKNERKDRIGIINNYLNVNVLEIKEKFRYGRLTKELTTNTALVFEDRAPNFNWGHECRYYLYNAETGDRYDKVKAEFPPNDFYDEPENYNGFNVPIRPIRRINILREKLKKKITPLEDLIKSIGKRYVILFSGMSNNRHTNDLEFLYRVLTKRYKISNKRIFVLNYDGTINYSGSPQPVGNWPGNNTPYIMKVNGEGSKSVLEDILDIVKEKIQEDDLLFIHTNNHGGGPPYDTESNLCCYPNWDSYSASEFAEKLSKFPRYRTLVVMMEQCHSGGFLKPIIKESTAQRTHIVAACEEDRSSIGGANFDPFALDWIAGINTRYPDGTSLSQRIDLNRDGLISANEVFKYADAVHDPYDTPVFTERPRNCGDKIFLGITPRIYREYLSTIPY